MITRHNLFLWSIGVVAGMTVVNRLLRSASVRNAKVTTVSLHPSNYASVVWSYGVGARPISVIIDLATPDGINGSITADGDLCNGEIPLSRHFRGAYTLTFILTYRLLGIVRTTTQTFNGRI